MIARAGYLWTMYDFIVSNWAALLLALVTFGDVIVSLTPTKADDRLLGYFRLLVNAITSDKRKKTPKKS